MASSGNTVPKSPWACGPDEPLDEVAKSFPHWNEVHMKPATAPAEREEIIAIMEKLKKEKLQEK